MQITAQTPKQVEQLYTRYQALSAYEQCLLKVLAITYRPVGVSKFNQLLSLVNNMDCFESSVHLPGLKPEQRAALVDQGFIEHDNSGMRLNPLLLNVLSFDCLKDESYTRLFHTVNAQAPAGYARDWVQYNPDKTLLVRFAFFEGSAQSLERILSFHKNPQVIDSNAQKVLLELCFVPFDLHAFLKLSDVVQYQAFATWFLVNTRSGYANDYWANLLQQVLNKNPGNQLLSYLLAEHYLCILNLDSVQSVIKADDNSCYALQLKAGCQMLGGNFKAANQLFDQAITAKNKFGRRKRQYLFGTLGMLHKLCLIIMGGEEASHYDKALDQIDAEFSDKNTESPARSLLYILTNIANCLSHGQRFSATRVHGHSLPYFEHLQILLNGLGAVWCGDGLGVNEGKALKASLDFWVEAEHALFVTLSEQLLSSAKTDVSGTLVAKNEFEKKQKTEAKNALVNFPSLLSRKAEWDLALEKLIALKPAVEQQTEAPEKSAKPARLIWELHLNSHSPEFKAREQKQTSNGWSKGRAVALKRLAKETDSFAYLSRADKAMSEAIMLYQSWDYYQSTEYRLEGVEALKAAVGLDNLYLAAELDYPIEIIQKEPELLVSQQGKQLLLSIADLPPFFDEENTFSFKEVSTGRYSFTVFNQQHIKVANIIGEGGLMIPFAAKQKALDGVAAIAPFLNIQSDIDELDTGLETLASDEHMVINIQPEGEGLEFTCLVMPFGDSGPSFKPIAGNAKLTTELAGKRVATKRNLIKEQEQLDALDEHCPAFLGMPDNVLTVTDPQAALATLEQLERLIRMEPAPIALRLRWPKGKKIQLSKTLKSEHLSLAIGKKNEWFDISGNLAVDEQQVLELRTLLDLIKSASGRFIQLDSGQVLALSEDLRKRLDLINQNTDDGKFHPLASMQVAEATTGMRMKTLHAWEAQTKRMHEANTITPELPTTLQAQLRDYQLEGFDWMCRLAHWGAGACLADDMGLGKTLQALALLLARADGGPSLVIAPTSVCYNWQQEALKFAPTLNLHMFSELSKSAERKKLLSQVKGGDCVVISYGLLQRQSALLADVPWHTIVADEAQALKNPLAKRTQAACALKGSFKVITTGTPIENNLTELWSLFRFIAPGLLGNIKRFGQRYAYPIENVKEDKLAARKASLGLKTLIQPFILRRMKNQVLTELPSRTEINTLVELSAQEQSFYEALRRNAVDNIAAASKSANEGEQRIKMLAELVKLRQACCNPQLVAPETELPSAKLAALDELLDELHQNHHKALIFSQFVGHLQLIKAHLDKRKMRYQYLDGATPQKARKVRVEAFQRGEGEVFLISLKAGGSGLNLTAADYVIHMDPWWNPAVEDQASDRAHRMGQKRPVTIYRLIAKNTIEERIVALHQHKRDLADKLLAGNEQASKLSVEDVLNMLKETF